MSKRMRLGAIVVVLLAVAGSLGGLALAGTFGARNQTPEPPSVSTDITPSTESITPSTESRALSENVAVKAADAVTGAKAPDAPAPALSEVPAGLETKSSLEPDTNFHEGLRNAGLSIADWKTDFSLHVIPYEEITQVLGRDGIPAIDSPQFTTPEAAADWLGGQEPVVAITLNGESRAYPLQILTWHEIVNDELGGVPVSITFCPLCNSALAFDRRLDGAVYDFGVSGKLRNSDLIMYDRQTHSWWQQFTGQSIVGELAGKQLTLLPASIVSFNDFKEAHPQGQILSQDTGFSRNYGVNPYAGYDQADKPPFLFDGETDGRLLPKERVVAVTIGEADAAFPYSALEREKVISYNVGGQDLVVFFKPGTASALDRSLIVDSRDVGATGVFDPVLDDRKLTFRPEGASIVDNETGSVWNILGQAVDGPLTGQALTPIIHADHFWFAWGAFKPDTKVYQGAG